MRVRPVPLVPASGKLLAGGQHLVEPGVRAQPHALDLAVVVPDVDLHVEGRRRSRGALHLLQHGVEPAARQGGLVVQPLQHHVEEHLLVDRQRGRAGGQAVGGLPVPEEDRAVDLAPDLLVQFAAQPDAGDAGRHLDHGLHADDLQALVQPGLGRPLLEPGEHGVGQLALLLELVSGVGVGDPAQPFPALDLAQLGGVQLLVDLGQRRAVLVVPLQAGVDAGAELQRAGQRLLGALQPEVADVAQVPLAAAALEGLDLGVGHRRAEQVTHRGLLRPWRLGGRGLLGGPGGHGGIGHVPVARLSVRRDQPLAAQHGQPGGHRVVLLDRHPQRLAGLRGGQPALAGGDDEVQHPGLQRSGERAGPLRGGGFGEGGVPVQRDGVKHDRPAARTARTARRTRRCPRTCPA